MNSLNRDTYCLFCITGQENKLFKMLLNAGYTPLAPRVVKWKPVAGKLKKQICLLIPGYVFFESDVSPNWPAIRTHESVLRILQYDDGERTLRGSDLEFVAWLKKYQGIIDISQAIQVGTKLQFVAGPLKDMAANIIKINKNRKQAQIALGDDASILRTVWCSIEFIESNTDGTVSRC